MKMFFAMSIVALTTVLSGCGREPCSGGQDPEGATCSTGNECSRNCICENGEEISAGVCTNNVCESVAAACTQQCAEFEFGGFTGGFCAPRDL